MFPFIAVFLTGCETALSKTVQKEFEKLFADAKVQAVKKFVTSNMHILAMLLPLYPLSVACRLNTVSLLKVNFKRVLKSVEAFQRNSLFHSNRAVTFWEGRTVILLNNAPILSELTRIFVL